MEQIWFKNWKFRRVDEFTFKFEKIPELIKMRRLYTKWQLSEENISEAISPNMAKCGEL